MFDINIVSNDLEQILAHADSTTVSAKSVRKELQIRYPSLDVKANKSTIDEYIVAAFQRRAAETTQAQREPLFSSPGRPESSADLIQKLPTSKPVKRERQASVSDDGLSTSPPPMRLKKPASGSARSGGTVTLTDEEYARLLNRQENGIATRGEASGSQSRKVARRPRVVDPNAPRRPPSMTGFNKLHYLSTDLSAVCGGVTALSRPQVTKALWVYIKAHDLQNPANKMEVFPDHRLKKIMHVDRIHSFTMSKMIGAHLFPYDG